MSGKTVEVEAISILRRESGHFRLRYKVKDEKDYYSHEFYLLPSEMKHILNNPGFWPYFADCYSLLQVTETALHFANVESPDHIYIHFRDKELFPEFTKVLDYPINQELDLMPAYLDSIKKAQPNVHETITDQAMEITKLEGIKYYMDRVRDIANNRSAGVDDPIQLTFFDDFAPKSLYWTITREDKLCMNGGIIWHEHSNEWGIHT